MRTLLAALLALVSHVAPAAANDGAERHLVLLHTNDIHGQVLPRPATWLRDVDPLPTSGGLPRLAAKINELRAEARSNGADVLVVDGGDWFQGTPEGALDRGRAFLGALEEVGYDALTVGNHEFDHGVDVLLDHLRAVALPALLANVRTQDGEPLTGTRDYVVVERAGLRIAVVGLLTPSTPTITHASTQALRFDDPAATVARIRDELGETVDWILPVCHMGVEHERALAAAHPWLDVVVGGHSHTFLRQGVREGEVLVVQAGAKASAVGRVDLWFDEAGDVVRSEARLVELYDDPAPEHVAVGVEKRCAEIRERAAQAMDEVVGVLARPLEQSRRPLINTSSGNFITDLMRERTGADVAIHNRGGIRTSLPAGPVTRRDLFMILPFANHLVTVELEGRVLREMVRRSVEGGRTIEFSGMTVRVRMEAGQPRFVELLVGSEPVLDEQRYAVTTNSFLAEGKDDLIEFADATPRVIDWIVLRDLVEVALDGGARTPNVDQRYEVQR